MASSQPTEQDASLLTKKNRPLLSRLHSASVAPKPTATTLLLTELLDGGKKKPRKSKKGHTKYANRKATTTMAAAPKSHAPRASTCWTTALSRQQNLCPPVDVFGSVLNGNTSGTRGPLVSSRSNIDKKSATTLPTACSSTMPLPKSKNSSTFSNVRKPCTVGTEIINGVQQHTTKRKDISGAQGGVFNAYKKSRTRLNSEPLHKVHSACTTESTTFRNNYETEATITVNTEISTSATAKEILNDANQQQNVVKAGINGKHECYSLTGTTVEESESGDRVADAEHSENLLGEVLTATSTQSLSLLQFHNKTNRLRSIHSHIAQRQAKPVIRTDCMEADIDHDLVLPMPQSGNLDPESLKTVEVSERKYTLSYLSAVPTLAGASFNNPAWKPIPLLAPSDDDDDDDGNTNKSGPAAKCQSKNSKPSDNFVRLNLRNKAGSCRNTRNRSSKSTRRWQERQAQWQELKDKKNNTNKTNKLFAMSASVPISAGVDPVDDFVDGVFACKTASTRGKAIPVCTGHQQPCKLLTVKKTGPNKGRKFYACSFPRSEQCNHFQWVDDTVQAAQDALLRNRSQSGFVARQVATYMRQIRDLTVPELRDLARRHQLDSTGKKAQLLMRLSIWVRDEVAASFGTGDDSTNDIVDGTEEKVQNVESCEPERTEDDEVSLDNSSDDEEDCDSASSSEEELEVIGYKTMLEVQGDAFNKSNTNNAPGPRSKRIIQSDSEDSSKDEADELKLGRESPIAVVPKRAKVDSPMQLTLRQLFGHSNFRDGQEWAIERCLNRQRSLLVAPTGFGKSLCFTLPAAMMDGVCIVVSPLLSLIQDQIRLLPARLPAVTLSGPMSTASMAATLDDIVRGRIKILFVSPERLTSSSFRRLFRQRWNQEARKYERLFPQVSLFCVDEAHCLSQWAHNFRPSYLRLRSMLNMIQPQSILAITATAGPRVASDICRTLQIADGSSQQVTGEGATTNEGVRILKTDRDNIDVCCLLLDTQEQRIGKLLKILSKKTKSKTKADDSDPLDGCLATGSVIVYVWRQRDAEIVAENIQAGGASGGVAVYHGGMDATARAKAQSRFMRGKVRICVATIAFGLGINKADVEGVVHMYLSSSPEHYLQEIGRAGRDERPAKAVALVLREEVFIRHSLAHTDLISKSQIMALLSFLHRQVEDSVASLPPNRSTAQPVNISLPLAMSVLGCDCRTETAETIVSLLEEKGDEEPLLFVEGISYDSATVAPKRCKLDQLAAKEPVAKAILHCALCMEPPAGEPLQDKMDGQEIHSATRDRCEGKLLGHTYGSYSFSIAQASNCLGESAEPRHVFAALRRLESRGDIDFVVNTEPKDRSLNIRLTNAGMAVFKAGNQFMVDTLVSTTAARFSASISSCAAKVLDINYIMLSTNAVDPIAMDKNNSGKSSRLVRFQELIASYFEAEGCGSTLVSEPCHLPPFSREFTIRELSTDCQAVLAHLMDLQRASDDGTTRLVILGDSTAVDYTALTIAKFLHGIAPASFPVSALRQHHLFGKMQCVQFSVLLESVTALFDPKPK